MCRFWAQGFRGGSVAFFILLFALFAASPEVVRAEDDTPVVSIPEPKYDFGTVSQGSVVEHEFTVSNKGTKDLIIQRVVPACGCTAAALDNESIQPNAEGKIKIRFDTTGFSGRKVKTVRLYTNDPITSSSILTLEGSVEPDISVSPQRVDLGDVLKGTESPEQKIYVDLRAGDVSVTGIKSFSKKLVLGPLVDEGARKSFTVALKDDVPIGEVRERVILGVKGSQRQSVNIPVYARVKGAIQLKPTSLSFGIIEGSDPLIRSVKVENLSKTPVKVSGVVSNSEAVRADVKTIKDGKIYVIQVEVNPTKVKKDLRASVTLETDLEGEPPLTISVFGINPPSVPS